MNHPVRLLSKLATLGSVAAFALSFTTGCSVASAVTHPQVAWVAHETPEMAVVVRRADAAETVTSQVDRLLRTPAAETDVGWTSSVGPDPVAAAREMRALREDPVYARSHARVVAAEVWAATLPQVVSAGGGQQSLLGAMSAKVASSYAQAALHPGQTTGRAQLLTDVRDAACKLARGDQEALVPALVNLEQAIDDAAVANDAARLELAQADATSASSIQEVVRHLAGDVLQERTRVRPDLAGVQIDVGRKDGGRIVVVISGLRPTDLGDIPASDVTDEVTVRAQAWLRRAGSLGERIAATDATLRLERAVLRQIRLGFNPNASIELPVAAHIPAADAPEVDAVAPAVRLPTRVAQDPRSASFEGATAPPAAAQPVDLDVRATDRPQA